MGLGAVLLVLFAIWAAAGYYRMAACGFGLIGLPIAGIWALGRARSRGAKAVIVVAILSGFGLALWLFTLALLGNKAGW